MRSGAKAPSKAKEPPVKRACVIGWPVAHSRSPVIHRYWLKLYGLDGAYELEAVRPEGIGDFLGSLRQRGYAGANVTLPHKEAALAAADRPDQAATAIGAANTLWLDDKGLLHASNTDAYGFMTHLSAEAPDWNKGGLPVMVLGAGGAARAVLHGLLEGGAAKILLANRTEGRAKAMAQSFGSRVSVPADATVADIVYSPLETPLLAAARARGNRIVDGLGMLLHQAVPGFERWFGVRPEVTPELRAHVAAHLGAS
jgi:shikimate dehydrogenase